MSTSLYPVVEKNQIISSKTEYLILNVCRCEQRFTLWNLYVYYKLNNMSEDHVYIAAHQNS